MSSPEAWIALATLTGLEIVLGIDNIVFISILSGKLPAHQQKTARQGGLALALISRILLLFSISWIMTLNTPLFSIFHTEITGKGIILIVGGLFLVGKATFEIHERLEGAEGHGGGAGTVSLAAVLIQILLLDVVFSIDSVITAVGMVPQEWSAIMYIAVVIAVAIMLVSSEPVSKFVNQHPTVKMLALAYLILIGVTLVGEAFHVAIPKAVVYGAMAFSVFVEMLNLLARRKTKHEPAVHLRPAYAKEFLERGTETVPVPSMVNRLQPVSPIARTGAGGRGQQPRRRKSAGRIEPGSAAIFAAPELNFCSGQDRRAPKQSSVPYLKASLFLHLQVGSTARARSATGIPAGRAASERRPAMRSRRTAARQLRFECSVRRHIVRDCSGHGSSARRASRPARVSA